MKILIFLLLSSISFAQSSFQIVSQLENDMTFLNGLSYQIDNKIVNYQINAFGGFYKEDKIVDEGFTDSYWDTDLYFQVKLGFKVIQYPITFTIYPFYFDAKLRDGYRVPIGLEIKKEIIPNLSIAVSSEHTWFKRVYGQIRVNYTLLNFSK